MDHAIDGFLILDNSGHIIDVNAAYCRLAGYLRESLLKMTLHDIQALESEQQTADHLQQVQENGIHGYETQHVRSDGRTIDVQINLKLLKANTQYVLAFVHYDGTKKETDRLDINESQRRLQAIVDNTSAVIYAKDLNGEYLMINKTFGRLFKVNTKIRGKTDHDIFPKKIADAFRENDKKVVKTNRPVEYDETVMFEGEERTYLSVKFPIYDNNGKVYAIGGISTDITERKEMERSNHKLLGAVKKEQITVKKLVLEIEKNRRFLTDVLDSVPISLVYCDPDLIYKLCNDEAAKVLNRKKKDVIGRHVKEVTNNNRQIIESFKEVLKTCKTKQMQPLYYKTPGSDEDRCYLTSYIPHKDGNGNVIGVIAEGQDVTSLMQAQSQLEFEKKQLEVVLSSMDEGVMIANSAGILTHVNLSATYYLDDIPKSVDEVNKYMELMTLDKKLLPLRDYPLRRVLRGEKFTDWHLIRKAKHSHMETVVSVNGTQVLEDGKVSLGIITFRDITAQKKATDLGTALNKINEILNSRMNFDKKFNMMLNEAANALQVETAAILLKQDDHWQIQHSYNFPEEFTNIRFTDKQARAHILALENGKTAVFNDATADKRLDQQIVKENDFKSFMVTPFEIKDSFVGGLSFHYHSEFYDFTAEEIDFAEKLGSAITLTLQNMRLEEKGRQELSRTRLLQEVASATASSLKLEKITNKVLNAIKKHLDIRVGSVYHVSEDNNTLEHLALYGYPEEIREGLQNIPLDQGSNMARLVSSRLPILTHESPGQSEISTKRIKAARLENSRWIILPIEIKDSVAGTFALAFDGLRGFSKDEIDLYKSITRLLGTAIENARLFEAEQQAHIQEELRAKRLEALNELTQVRLASSGSQDMARRFTRKASKMLGIDFIVILMADKKNGQLIPTEWFGVPDNISDAVKKIPVNLDTQPNRVFKNARPEFVGNMDNYRIPGVFSGLIKKTGIDLRSFATLPLQGKNETLGVISLGWLSDQQFIKNDIDFFETMVSQLAIGIESIQLLEESVRQARTFQAINQMGSLISATLKLSETLDLIADYSMLLLDASASIILVNDKKKDTYKVRASEGISKTLASLELSQDEILKFRLNERHATKVFQLGDLSGSNFFDRCMDEKLVSGISAPIYIENELFGIIITLDTKPIILSEHERSAFNFFTNQVFAAINNTQRFEAERLVANTLQQALMVMPREIDNISFGHIYNSATEIAKVGGDFYDIFRLAPDKVGIIIGDVSGKGLEAATVTALAKNTIKAYAFENYSPEIVMQKTNRILRDMLQESIFMTVFFGIIDINKRELSYCSCGHPQVILRKKNLHTSFMKTDSPVVGVMSDAKFQLHKTELLPGDLLVLYTDGVTEARSDSGFFGENNLLDLIKNKYKSEGPEELSDLIFKEIRAYTKGVLIDDIAILSLGISS